MMQEPEVQQTEDRQCLIIVIQLRQSEWNILETMLEDLLVIRSVIIPQQIVIAIHIFIITVMLQVK